MTNRQCSDAQECMVAKLLSWKVVSGSGASACHPGDVRSDTWLGECKTHVVQHVPVCFKQSVWLKICQEAASQYKYPILFCDDGVRKLDHTWCLFPISVLEGYMDVIEYPFAVKVNLSFNHREMVSKLSGFLDSLINVTWCDQKLCLCTLHQFYMIASDMGWTK